MCLSHPSFALLFYLGIKAFLTFSSTEMKITPVFLKVVNKPFPYFPTPWQHRFLNCMMLPLPHNQTLLTIKTTTLQHNSVCV